MKEIRQETICSCEMPGSLECIANIAGRLRQFCEQRLIDPKIWAEIELGLCEALNNAVEHGCQEDDSKTIRIKWQWDDSNLKIEIEDPGPNVSSDSINLPDDPLAESGRGLYIIESVFDSCQHEPSCYGHRIVLEKSIHPPQCAVSKLQETYQSLVATSGELQANLFLRNAYREFVSALKALDHDSQSLTKAIGLFKEFAKISSVEVWIVDGTKIVNRAQDNIDWPTRQPLLRTQKQHPSLTRAIEYGEGSFIEECSELPKDSIGYSKFKDAYVQPIVGNDALIGLFIMRSDLASNRAFEHEQIESARFAADCLALALKSEPSAKRQAPHNDGQLETAAEIQRSLLPSAFPDNEYCRVAGKCVTAMAVGGDYIDAIDVRGQGLLLVIADVMGKGVPAAMLATVFRTAIRSRLNLAETPGWLLAQIDKQIHEELGHLSMFITAQAAYFSYGDRSLKLSSAGHCPAFLLRPGESSPTQLTSEGMPLGIQPADLYEEKITSLGTGDRVLFITDGIYESHDEDGEALGLDGFAHFVPEIWRDGLEAAPEKALALAEDHSSVDAFQDDKTLMALEVL